MPKKDLTKFLDDPVKNLPTDKLYVGYLTRSKVNKLLDDGDIDKNEHSQFFMTVFAFIKEHSFMQLKTFP